MIILNDKIEEWLHEHLWTEDIPRIKDYIQRKNNGESVKPLFIQGCSTSGKSTLAKIITDATFIEHGVWEIFNHEWVDEAMIGIIRENAIYTAHHIKPEWLSIIRDRFEYIHLPTGMDDKSIRSFTYYEDNFKHHNI